MPDPGPQSPPPDEKDDLDLLVEEVYADDAARATYEEACRRNGVEPEPRR